MRAFAEPNDGGEDRRWLWLACRLAQDPWDEELWHVLATRGVRVARDTGALSLLPIMASYLAALNVHSGAFAAAAALIGEVDAITRTTDLYLTQDRFHAQFCADVPAPQAARMAATQRPATQEALFEPSGERPLWKELPSWFLFGELDRNIPAELEHFMAKRARAHRAIEIPGASHAVPVAHPDATAHLILEAAAVRVAA